MLAGTLKSTKSALCCARHTSFLAAWLILVSVAVFAEPLPNMPGSKTKSFVFTYMWFAIYESAEDCPDGLNTSLRDVAIMHLPAAEQARLKSPKHRSEYTNMGMDLGRQRRIELGDESSCDHPDKFDDPAQTLVSGKLSLGFDLDGHDSTTGSSAANSCPHLDFMSPDGRNGIDNQFYRVAGCIESYRRDSLYVSGGIEDFVIGAHLVGRITTLMEINGIDDPLNDDSVEVAIYSSEDPVPYDSQEKGLPHASLTATDNPRWRNVTQGSIKNGVLITDTFDLLLKYGYRQGAEYDLKKARLELKLLPDGHAEGTLAGFYDLDMVYRLFKDRFGEVQAPYGYTCPAVHKALAENADGYPDPDTGKCTAISTAFTVKAMPAFVIQPDRVKTPEEIAAEAENNKKWGG
jgi:hypothetical protein